jgi:hypothetical protein
MEAHNVVGRRAALRAGRPLSPRKIPSTDFWVDTRAIVRLEGLGLLKKIQWPHRDSKLILPACSLVPQPTTLPRARINRAPSYYSKLNVAHDWFCCSVLLQFRAIQFAAHGSCVAPRAYSFFSHNMWQRFPLPLNPLKPSDYYIYYPL